MRIGIDFDNTIICYDEVFCQLAITQGLVSNDFRGTKTELRNALQKLPEGDLKWQHLQGKAYGVEIHRARMFDGFKEFIQACNINPDIELFIVSHKTELGHFDETKTSLRTAAREWLRNQNLFNRQPPYIQEANLYFETTREEKISRIIDLKCTHFIDDLVEVLDSPLFPKQIERILFQPINSHETIPHSIPTTHSNWFDIKQFMFDDRI